MNRLGMVVIGGLLAVSPAGCGCFVPVDESPPDGWPGDGGGVGGFPTGAVILPARLPVALHEPAVVWDGQQIWIFGGMTPSGAFTDAVLRFDPATETLHTTSYRLPSARQASAGIAWGGFIYLFGGRSSMTDLMTQIVRFNPSTGVMTPMSSSLPSGRYNLAIAATSSRIFLFGGYDYTKVRQILSYDPLSDVLTTLPAQLTPGRESPVAVPSGSRVFLLGGSDSGGQLSEILQFDTTTGQLSPLASTLPYAPWQPAPFAIDGFGYLYGGQAVQTVLRFDPGSGQATTLPGVSVAGGPAMGRGTASLPGRGYVFGGAGPNEVVLDRIVRFVP